MHGTRLTAVLALATAVAAGTFFQSAAAAELAQQSNSAAGVTVRAKPRDVSAGATALTFEIVLETHSTDLSDDLMSTASLAGPGGAAQRATGWEGDPPGGHHRKGLLRFVPLKPRPDVLVLTIMRPGESKPRTFQWPIK